jgi:hypothetical protein
MDDDIKNKVKNAMEVDLKKKQKTTSKMNGRRPKKHDGRRPQKKMEDDQKYN